MIGQDVLPVVCNTSDLGCDLQYSRKVCKPLGKKRWAKATRVCGKIALSKAPKGFKRRLAKGAAISAASFGINLQAVPKTQWKILRTAISRALGCSGAGASPWLALAACCLDPQLGGLISSCRFWRRFLSSFPLQTEPFDNNLIHCGSSKIGPVANFRKTLHSAGWTVVTPYLLEHHHNKIQVKWRECSDKHLAYVFQKCWPCVVIEKSPLRKDWDRKNFDIPMYMRLVKHRNPHQTAVLQGFTAGKHFTNDIIHKYDTTVDPKCPFCTCNDGRHHRLFICKAFREIRVRFSKAVQWASKQSDSLKYFGLPCFRPTIWDKIQAICPSKPTWNHPPPDDEPWWLFLDGSAFGQTQKDIVISAWAVVRAPYMVHNFETVSCDFTPSWEHSSYRAEVSAILGALQVRQHCHLFSDCQAATDTLQDLLRIRQMHGVFPKLDHQDLWFPIWDLLCNRPPAAVTITKVAAHQVVSKVRDPVQQWYTNGNNFTDVVAKEVVTNHPIHKLVVQLEKRFDQDFQLHKEYHDYVCAVAAFAYSSKPKVPQCTQEGGFELPDFSQWGPQDGFHFDLPAFGQLPNGCPFGSSFYNRVRGWFSKLKWTTSGQGIQPVSHIGLLELYFDFVVTTQTESPVNVGKRPISDWRLLDEYPLLQSPPSPLSRHTYSWTCFWKWCHKHCGVQLPFQWIERMSLGHIGYSLMASCITPRPRLVHFQSSLAVWRYFHETAGRRRDLSAPLRPLPQIDRN